MHYKINEVSQITGISIDTLRYYEKIGVISPKIDQHNNYRYYEAWDINFIFDYNNYRKLEYSSKEALNFIHGATLSEQIDILHKKRLYYDQKIAHYQRLKERSNILISEVENLEHSLNQITITQSLDFKYILYRKNYDFHGFKDYKEELRPWLSHLEFTDNIILVDHKIIESGGENDYAWGLLVRNDDFAQSGLQITENVRDLPSSLCLKLVVEAGSAGTFHYHLLDPALEYMKAHNFTFNGDPFGILWIRSHKNNDMHRYFTFFIPIK